MELDQPEWMSEESPGSGENAGMWGFTPKGQRWLPVAVKQALLDTKWNLSCGHRVHAHTRIQADQKHTEESVQRIQGTDGGNGLQPPLSQVNIVKALLCILKHSPKRCWHRRREDLFLKKKQKTESSQLESESNQFETPEQSKRSRKLNSFILKLFATGTNNYSHPAPPAWDTNCQHVKGKIQKKYTQYLLKYEQSISPHRGFFFLSRFFSLKIYIFI